MSTPPRLSPAGLIASDLPCLVCGYNLRTQPLDGICPECATAVAESIRGDGLALSNVRWLQKLRLALLLQILTAFGGILLYAMMFIMPWLPYRLGLWEAYRLSYGLGSLVIIPSLGLVGVLFLTLKEPDRPFVNVRFGVRIALKVIAIVQTLALWGTALMLLGEPYYPLFLFNALIFLPKTILFYLYLSRLAARMPSLPLVRSARRLMWVTAIITVLGIILFHGLPLIMVRQTVTFGIIRLVYYIIAFIVAIWIIFLLVRLRGELRRIIQWATPPPRDFIFSVTPYKSADNPYP